MSENPIFLIKKYYEENKEQLEKELSEALSIREEFIKKFPLNELESIDKIKYCLNKTDRTFCYYIEYALRGLGKFFAGNASFYLIYNSNKNGEYINKSKYSDDDLIKKIGQELYKMATVEDYSPSDEFFKGARGKNFAMKIYNTYNLDTFFPIYSRIALLKLCKKFALKIDKKSDIIELNKIVKNYFNDNIKDIKPSILSLILSKKILDKAQDITILENIKLNKYIELLKQNKNIIFTGAPGTGKTYLAKQIASKLCFDEKYENILKNENLKKAFDIQCGFVQFHPSYDYTDFVEGLRPVNNGESNIGFERRDGVFKEFCKSVLLYPIIIKYLIPYFISLSDDLKKHKEYTLTGFKETEIAPFISIKFFDVYNNSIDNISNINNSNFQIHIEIGTKDKPVLSGHINEYVYWYILFKKRLKENNFTVVNFAREINRNWVHTYVCALLKDFDEKYSKKIEREIKNIGIEKVQEKNFVFIIDEINRGEISKIFGELFFSVDPGYRGKKGLVKTQYQNLIKDDVFFEGFYIPKNVYIIGTMNDIDRSVESMDFAMRRRFAFVEVDTKDTQNMIINYFNKPDNKIKEKLTKRYKEEEAYNIIKEIINQSIDKMNSLNNKIASTEGLSKHYEIGSSYFLKLENYIDDDLIQGAIIEGDVIDNAFESLWEYHLKGLLTEYLRGNPEEESILQSLKDAYNLINEDPNNNEDDDIEEIEENNE